MLKATGNRFMVQAAVLLSGVISTSSASAQLIAADSFDTANYATGGLNGQNPMISPGWTSDTAWSSGSANLQADTISLSNPTTTYDDASDGKGKFLEVASNFPLFRRASHDLDSYEPADTYFMSFFVNPSGSFAEPGSREHALVGFTNFVSQAAFENANADNAFGLLVGFRGEDVGAATDTVDLIVRARDVSTGDLVDTVLIADAGNEPFGDTYHVMLKLDINVDGGVADDVTYWVNPTNLTSETTATDSAAATGIFQSAAMDLNDRIDRLTVLTNFWTDRGFFWDETRFGYDFSSVAGVLPLIENADFDDDGDVDGSDYLIWQRGFDSGTTQPEGDANNTNTVDGEDLAIWRNQYGVVTELGGATNIPEPNTLLLVLLGNAYLLGTRRGRI